MSVLPCSAATATAHAIRREIGEARFERFEDGPKGDP